MRPEVVVTGEVTLSGYVVGVAALQAKLLAAVEDPEVRVVGLSVDNYIGEHGQGLAGRPPLRGLSSL